MSEIVNVTFPVSPVIVQMVTSSESVNVAVTTAAGNLAVTVAVPPAQPVSLAVESVPRPVIVQISLGGPPGPSGANAEHVILTLAAYLALSPAVQMDGRWYLIPKT
jgi:hypothetical protein